jgi:hypothetical protein
VAISSLSNSLSVPITGFTRKVWREVYASRFFLVDNPEYQRFERDCGCSLVGCSVRNGTVSYRNASYLAPTGESPSLEAIGKNILTQLQSQ